MIVQAKAAPQTGKAEVASEVEYWFGRDDSPGVAVAGRIARKFTREFKTLDKVDLDLKQTLISAGIEALTSGRLSPPVCELTLALVLKRAAIAQYRRRKAAKRCPRQGLSHFGDADSSFPEFFSAESEDLQRDVQLALSDLSPTAQRYAERLQSGDPHIEARRSCNLSRRAANEVRGELEAALRIVDREHGGGQ